MSQKELKEVAYDTAYQLISALDKIQDEDFVDNVLCAVLSNDQISLVEMMYDELNSF